MNDEEPDDDLDEDVASKLSAIAHPERFVSNPGDMEPEEPEESGKEKRVDLDIAWERYWQY